MAILVKSLSLVRLLATPWTVAYQAPPSMGFSRQEYWSGLLFPSPGDLPDPGIEPRSPTLRVDALLSESPGKLSSVWHIVTVNRFIIIIIIIVPINSALHSRPNSNPFS